MKEVNPKQQIHKDWLAVRDARDKVWKRIDEELCHPNRKKLIKEWQELFDQEAVLYAKLTEPTVHIGEA